MRRVAALALLAALVVGGAARATPSLWTVHGPACEVTLFGSVHVLPEGVDWKPPALTAALARADELWFEIPIDPQSEMDAGYLARAHSLLPDGQSLTALLSKAGVRRLKTQAAAYGLSMERLDHMQPWFAELAVSSAVYSRAGGRQTEGVEEQLAGAAPDARRRAFETAAQQIDMFAGAPIAEQVASLESTLKEVGKGQQEYRDLVASWAKGDDRSIYRQDVLTLKRETPGLFKTLITDRNAAWTRTLAERLNQPCQGAVVVVGAGHLLGPDGVPAKLRALGFKVDGPRE